MAKNKIIQIGPTGNVQCYLNVSMEDACKRWIDSEGFYKYRIRYPNTTDFDLIETHLGDVSELNFDDEFSAYSIESD